MISLGFYRNWRSSTASVVELIAVLKGHGVLDFVLCPGSRDYPIVESIGGDRDFTCYQLTDERSAGFFALGVAQAKGRPCAVVCTSGSAVLNLHPAVAEAYYRRVPLVVISADRPGAWIGQMDGQTLPQVGVFGGLVGCSVNLVEARNKEELWHCNRLINEALLAAERNWPVHINVPLSEPFDDFRSAKLPEARIIRRLKSLDELIMGTRRRMVIFGQDAPLEMFDAVNFLRVGESLSNVGDLDMWNVDWAVQLWKLRRPELLVTLGGHIISPHLKSYLRKNPPKYHVHVSDDEAIADVFCCQTHVMNTSDLRVYSFPDYPNEMVDWENAMSYISEPELDWSERGVVGRIIKLLPDGATLHLANSSTVRHAQRFRSESKIRVCCNRGVNGIEGCLSAAVGYAAASEGLNVLIIGDLSFFYDMNGLWNPHVGGNLRILLINNKGGKIFDSPKWRERSKYTLGTHDATAKGWAETLGIEYLQAGDLYGFNDALPTFLAPSARAMLFELMF